MNERLKQETEKLIQSWMQHDDKMLRDYLVSSVEDPRINVQSILNRHFLTEALFGDRYVELADHELRFALAMNWFLQLSSKTMDTEDLQTILYALRNNADNAEGIEIPHFLLSTFTELPTHVEGCLIPNYIESFIFETEQSGKSKFTLQNSAGTFQSLWEELLDREPDQTVSVLEPACGSANDFRSIDACGLGRFINYTGFDLCEKNIRNAKAMFPNSRFEVGNAFQIDAPDKTFDYCFIHDLFEHLSIEGLEAAISEVCRVTNKALFAGFFQMDEISDHIVRPVDDYHWNKLSMAKTKALFEHHSSKVAAVHLDTFLRFQYQYAETHNKDAYTFLVSF